MPVSLRRDPDLTRAVIARWLAERFPGEGTPVVGPISTPAHTGFSGEILLCDAEWDHRGPHRVRPLAIRVAPTGHRLFPGDDWDRHTRLQALLAGTDVPVAKIHGTEPTGELLGVPFVVMERIPGDVPSDLPSYHHSGWLARLPASARAEVWNGGLELMAKVHRLDPGTVDLSFLDKPSPEPAGIGRQLEEYAAHLTFYGAQDSPVVIRALHWLRSHRPPEPDAPRLLWGDARLANIICAGQTPVALLDWEMATLGAPECDLAWYLYTDRYMSEGRGLPRLAGLPDRQETVSRYASLLGRAMRHLPFYEVFAAFRFCLISSRFTRLMAGIGIQRPDNETPYARSTALLDRLLGETDACVRQGGTTVT
ncbi:phosphotransferase family protein [Streptomyces syringium]|uniref:phosphotransferase family protein n=1 Tax=Streptomyces syringium TaxID=76729 RepID=UPI003AACE065